MYQDYTIQLAAFRLIGASEINANSKDQQEQPVLGSAAALAHEAKDRAGYLAIGESDRITLKFTKPTTEAQAAIRVASGAERWLVGDSQ